MRRSAPSLADVLDVASDTVARVAAPWVGVLWLTSLPVQFLQAYFAFRLIEWGDEAGQYGDHLMAIAFMSSALFVLSLWGRAVFVRACELGLLSSRPPGWEALRIPLAAWGCYVSAALLIEALFLAFAVTLLAIPLLILLAGLAAATFPQNERPSLVQPLREIARHLRHGWLLLGLLSVMGVAVFVAFANLWIVFRAGLWLTQGVPGVELAAWDSLLGPGNPRFLILLVAGALLAVEPFWLGALVVYVHKARSRESGFDLRLWFDRLRTVQTQ